MQKMEVNAVVEQINSKTFKLLLSNRENSNRITFLQIFVITKGPYNVIWGGQASLNRN